MVPVNLYGHPVRVPELRAHRGQHGLFWIEDLPVAWSPISRRDDRRDRRRGSVFVLSLQDLTVLGDGGMVTTNRDDLATAIRQLRDHGRSDKYTHEVVGYNMRFNEIQAAVGRIQLAELPGFRKGAGRARGVTPRP